MLFAIHAHGKFDRWVNWPCEFVCDVCVRFPTCLAGDLLLHQRLSECTRLDFTKWHAGILLSAVRDLYSNWFECEHRFHVAELDQRAFNYEMASEHRFACIKSFFLLRV